MSRLWTGFRSVFADGMRAFLAYKRALGRHYRAEESALRLLDRFLVEHRVSAVDDVTPSLIDDFLVSRPRPAPRSYNHLHGSLVRFFDWMIHQERLQHSPVRSKPRRGTRVRLPFLLDPAAARRLFDVAGRLPDNRSTTCRGSSFRTIFTLLYGLGLRVGESHGCASATSTPPGACFTFGTRSLPRAVWFRSARESAPCSPRISRSTRTGSSSPPRCPSSRGVTDGRSAPRPSASRSISSCRNWIWPSLTAPSARGSTTCGMRSRPARCCAGTGMESTLARSCRLSPRFSDTWTPASTAVYLTMTPELLSHANERFRTWAELVLEEVPR